MWAAYERFLDRYHELEGQMADPAVISDRARYAQTAKEHGSLARQVKPYEEFKAIEEEMAQTEALLSTETDGAMQHYLEEELASQRQRHQTLRTRLEDLLLVEPSENFASIIMEIRAGTGGDEAAL